MKGNKMTNPGRFIVALAIGASAFAFNARAAETDNPDYTPAERNVVRMMYDFKKCVNQKEEPYAESMKEFIAAAEGYFRKATADVGAMAPAERDERLISLVFAQEKAKSPMTNEEAQKDVSLSSRAQKIRFLALYEANKKTAAMMEKELEAFVLEALIKARYKEDRAKEAIAGYDYEDKLAVAARHLAEDAGRFRAMNDEDLSAAAVEATLDANRIRTIDDVVAEMERRGRNKKDYFLAENIADTRMAMAHLGAPKRPGAACMEEMNINQEQADKDTKAFLDRHGMEAFTKELRRIADQDRQPQ